jgi:hypothetical protein
MQVQKDSAGRDQSLTWKELSNWRGNLADVRLPTNLGSCR